MSCSLARIKTCEKYFTWNWFSSVIHKLTDLDSSLIMISLPYKAQCHPWSQDTQNILVKIGFMKNMLVFREHLVV